MQFKYLQMNIKKSVFGGKLYLFQTAILRRMYKAYSIYGKPANNQ